MRKKIVVTKGDIKNGLPSDECFCPVALAIARGLKTEVVEVWGDGDFYINGKIIEQPEKVETFIDRFDSRKDVKPFSFFIDIPD